MKEMTYEKSMQRLEEISKLLETGECSLEESVTLFEEGTKIADYCDKCLKNAEQKITQLARDNME